MELQEMSRPPVDIENAILQRRKAMKTSFGTQANAILRKNLIFQKRNWMSSCCLVSLPIFLCLLLVLIQALINLALQGSDYKCGCQCLERNSAGKCVKKACGFQYSNSNQAGFCAVPHPPEWTPFQQIGKSQYRAVQRNSPYFGELPDPSCRNDAGGCPATVLYTGSNKTFADQLGSSLLLKSLTQSASRYRNKSEGLLLEAVLATSNGPSLSLFFETGVIPGKDEEDIQPSRFLQYACQNSPTFDYTINSLLLNVSSNISCLNLLSTWRANRDAINKELYAGYYKSRTYGNRIINEYSAAYDFQDSNPKKFKPIIIYNDTIAGLDEPTRGMIRIPRALNLATNAFIRTVVGANSSIPLKFVKEFPKPETKLSLDFSSLLGPLFYMWLILLLYPVILGALVYEKERNLRTMMKMHGLGSPAYWIVTYLYYLILSTVYILFFVIFGSIIGLKFFRLNSYALQFIFYFVFVNNQISFAFLSSVIFSKSKVAYVCGYLYVFLLGLLGKFLFEYYLEDTKFPRGAVTAIELFPAFGLYRGLYELGQYSFNGGYLGTDGMTFSSLNDPNNGFETAIAILAIEWLIFLISSLYLDQVVASGSGIRKHPLFFLKYLGINFDKSSKASKKSHLAVEDDGRERPGVAQEKEVVESLGGPSDGYSIVCNNLQKVYPGTDGNPDKFAVREMYLAVQRGECFGMLGPNGAGKTTSINMMIGFLSATSGSAFIEGLDISKDMDTVYSMMGVCPQHDLLWDQLTGREHLLFYGRLKNLKGEALQEAVENSLKSVNLFYGGVADKMSGAYSGGMKRRLSVAISLIGDPLVVYMDEPSTGLDPASRKNLWSVVKNAKKDRAIILTTHSMEEAEALCDRLGIFVDGRFECIGNPKTLTSLYGGTYVLTVTTPPEEEENVSRIVRSLSSNAKKIYGLSGTQKYELPTHEVDIADVFSVIQREKKRLSIRAWGVANTTLEDVFITIAKNAMKHN